MGGLQVLEITVPVGRGRPSVDEDVGSGDEPSAAGKQEFGQVAHFIGCSGPFGGSAGDHLEISFCPGAVEFVIRQGSDDDSRGDAVYRRTTSSPFAAHCSAWSTDKP